MTVHAVQVHCTDLCDDDIAVCSVLIGYHVVEDELWHLCSLSTPSVPLDDDNLVALNGRHYLGSLVRYWQAKTIF